MCPEFFNAKTWRSAESRREKKTGWRNGLFHSSPRCSANLCVSALKARGGFTFVEVLAALTFLAILVPTLLGALSIANRASVMAERSAIAGQLGENKLNE